VKTRIIYTKIWKDSYFNGLNDSEQKTFLYLLTNERVNICGIYELPDKEKMFDLNFNKNKLAEIKKKFQDDNKFLFIGDWVTVINHEKYNKYLGEKNEVAKQRELDLVPKEVLNKETISSCEAGILAEAEALRKNASDRVSRTPDTPHNHNKKSYSGLDYLASPECYNELSKQFPNLEISGIKTKCEELTDYCKAKGKKYSNYLAFARNAIRKDLDRLPKKTVKEEVKHHELTDEERTRAKEKLAKIKKDFNIGG